LPDSRLLIAEGKIINRTINGNENKPMKCNTLYINGGMDTSKIGCTFLISIWGETKNKKIIKMNKKIGKSISNVRAKTSRPWYAANRIIKLKSIANTTGGVSGITSVCRKLPMKYNNSPDERSVNSIKQSEITFPIKLPRNFSNTSTSVRLAILFDNMIYSFIRSKLYRVPIVATIQASCFTSETMLAGIINIPVPTV